MIVEEEGTTWNQVELTPRDLKVIQTGAQYVVFKKNQVIIPENSVNYNLYQIKSGKVRVEKMINGNPKVLSVMEPPQLFGEMSILNSSTTNVSIVGDSDVIELYPQKKRKVLIHKVNEFQT